MAKQSRLIMLIGNIVSILANGAFLFGGITLLVNAATSPVIYGLWIAVSILTGALSIFGLVVIFMPSEKSGKWRFMSLVPCALNMTAAVFFIIHMETTGGDSPTYLQAFILGSASLLLLAGFFRSFEYYE